MEEWLNSILRRIVEGSLLPAVYFAEIDCDAALDCRDRDEEFDASWVRLHEDIECRWARAAVAQNLRALAENIRRESFLAVSRATGQHEIASYVSDDFGLVVRGRLVGLADSLLDQLWRVYDEGKFPKPPFERERRVLS
jgi:hypothetical protein